MQLKGIGSHFSVYCFDHNGEHPPSFSQFVKKSSLGQKYLHCPSDSDSENESYIYIGKDVNENMSRSLILAYEKKTNHRFDPKASVIQKIGYFFTFNLTCPKGRNVLFNDHFARPLTEHEFKTAMEKDKKLREEFNISSENNSN